MNRTYTHIFSVLVLVILCSVACKNQDSDNGFPTTEKEFREGYFKDDPMQRPGLADGRRITDFTLTCDAIGPIRLTDDFEKVEQIVGKENIKIDSHFVEGNFEGLLTTLWPLTNKEARIYWLEKKPPFSKIRSVEINHPMSVWQFSNGLKVGTSLDQIVNMNGGKPVTFYGFYWDYGGKISSFNDGRLAAELPCVSGTLSPTEEADTDQVRNTVSGDSPISSDVPGLKEMKVELSTIVLLPGETK